MTAFSGMTKSHVLVAATGAGVGTALLGAAMALVPSVDATVVALGGIAAQNPIPLMVAAVFATGHSPILARFTKSSGKGEGWVSCKMCGRFFRDDDEVSKHSSGYHY